MLMKTIALVVALLFSASAKADERPASAPTLDDVRAMIIEVTGEDIDDVEELRPACGVAEFDEWYDIDEEVVCGPYASIDEAGHCKRYYELKRSIEEIIERLEPAYEEQVEDEVEPVDEITTDELEEKIWLDYYNRLEYGPNRGCSSAGFAGGSFWGTGFCLGAFGILLGLKRRNLHVKSG